MNAVAILLDVVLAPRARQLLLAATLMHPERWWFGRDLARQVGIVPSHAHKELHKLTEAGILERRAEGKHVYYRANQGCPLYPELRSILRKTVGLTGVLREALQPFLSRIRVALVYGSLALGEETAASDVDLLVVGEVTLRELVIPLREAQSNLLRTVNPTVLSPAELAEKVAARNHFVTSVLAGAKHFVVGTADDLEAAAR